MMYRLAKFGEGVAAGALIPCDNSEVLFLFLSTTFSFSSLLCCDSRILLERETTTTPCVAQCSNGACRQSEPEKLGLYSSPYLSLFSTSLSVLCCVVKTHERSKEFSNLQRDMIGEGSLSAGMAPLQDPGIVLTRLDR